jgi:hypothetical protein
VVESPIKWRRFMLALVVREIAKGPDPGGLGLSLESGRDELGGGLDGYGLDAGVEAALVAAGGVLVEDALLHAFIEDGGGEAVLLGGDLDVALGDGLAEDAQGSAELALVGAVDGGLLDGLTGALQGRDMICH